MTLDPKERARLQAAYERTEYRVLAPRGPLIIRIAQATPSLDVYLEEYGLPCWAYVTACNPQSQCLPPHINQERQACLLAELAAGAWKVFLGEGAAIDPGWEPEPSVLVLGMDRDRALELGRRYQQHAVVVGLRGGVAQLEWCPS